VPNTAALYRNYGSRNIATGVRLVGPHVSYGSCDLALCTTCELRYVTAVVEHECVANRVNVSHNPF
jgi:hypothetical protein